MGIERLFSRGKIVAAAAGLVFLAACSSDEPLIIDGKIELSQIPKELVFEAVHYGNYSQEPRVESGRIVEKVEHRCSKKENLEYCILKKTMFEEPGNKDFPDDYEEHYVITFIDDEKRRIIFAKSITTSSYVNVGEFIQTKYMPFGNNPDAIYMNKEFSTKSWKEFIKDPTTPLEKIAPNKIEEYRKEYTKEEISTFNHMRFLPGLREFVKSLGYYLTKPIRKTFNLFNPNE